jgi:hypothetical protein
MGPGHHHLRGGPHADGLDLWWLFPVLATALLLVLIAALWLARDTDFAELVAALRTRLARGSRRRWRAAVARHHRTAAAFAAYECSPEAVLRHPVLADVRQPATARFVEAFAEACALVTDSYPGHDMADAFADAAERSARAWAAATEAAGRFGAVKFAPGERELLDQAAALLVLARRTTHDGERAAAYGSAAKRLAELERRSGWALPEPAAAALRRDARGALAGSPA